MTSVVPVGNALAEGDIVIESVVGFEVVVSAADGGLDGELDGVAVKLDNGNPSTRIYLK